MNNNDILRRTRYILDLKDNQITKIFKHVNVTATEQQVNLWLKREEEEGFVPLPDETLVDFLDALIIEKRGKKEEPTAKVKQKLDNNLILMKLKIAFHLKAEEALAIMELADFKISKHEFSALFRKKDHKHYRVCKNQMLRKFMKGLQLKYRGQTNKPKAAATKSPAIKSARPEDHTTKSTPIKDVETPINKGKLSLKKATAKRSPYTAKTPHSDTENTTQKKPTKDQATTKPATKTAASVWKIPNKKS